MKNSRCTEDSRRRCVSTKKRTASAGGADHAIGGRTDARALLATSRLDAARL
jgi:hypothetical protein